jgi:hypothetical protein
MTFDLDGGIWRLRQPLHDGREFRLRDKCDQRIWEDDPRISLWVNVRESVGVLL